MSSAVIFGATGLVGSYLLKNLINDEYYTSIKIFTRSEVNIKHPKLEIINTDLNNVENSKDQIIDDCCFFNRYGSDDHDTHVAKRYFQIQ